MLPFQISTTKTLIMNEMKVTGNTRIAFEVYVYEQRKDIVLQYHAAIEITSFWTWWEGLPEDMKIGVFISFFTNFKESTAEQIFNDILIRIRMGFSVIEAEKMAIEDANELFNSQG